MELGKLTHKALELNIDQAKTLATYAPHLPLTAVEEALTLAQVFRDSSVYAAHRAGATHWEHPVSLTVGDLTLNGVVDLVGEDFVLDFKTDQTMHPEHHQFQLWAYSRATGKPSAYLAYLRHDHLHPFESGALQYFDHQANALVSKLMSGDFTPKAAHNNCEICPYGEFCDSRWAQ
jgi:ATP-dependent helicase/nuclease subunit A